MIKEDNKYQSLIILIENEIKKKLCEIKIFEDELNRNNEIQDVIKSFHEGNLDLEKLKSILDDENEFLKIKNLYASLKMFSLPLFKSQYDKCVNAINEQLKKISASKSIKMQGNINYRLRSYKESIVKLQSVISGLNSFPIKKVIDDEELEYIDDLLKQKNYSDEERLSIIIDIAKDNSDIMLTSIQKNVKKTPIVIEEKKEVKTEKSDNVVIKDIQKIKSEDDIPKEAIITNLQDEIRLVGENLKIYGKIMNTIHESNSNDKIDPKCFEVQLFTLEKGTSLDERMLTYRSIPNFDVVCKLIAADLEKNFIPEIVAGEELSNTEKEMINSILSLYQNYSIQAKKKPASIRENLKIHDMKPEYELINNSEELLNRLHMFISQNYGNNIDSKIYSEVAVLIDELEQNVDDFEIAVELYFELLDKKELNEYFNKLQEVYLKTLNYYKKISENKEEENEIDVDLDDDVEKFYGEEKYVKNIILTLPFDDSEESLFNEDIIENETLNKGNFNSIVTTLMERIRMDNATFMGQKDNKISDKTFSDEFLKRFHAKRIGEKRAKERIAFTRFTTNISPYVGKYEESPHIIIILGLSSFNDKDKHENFRLALTRCHEHANSIMKLVDFLNPDWEKMTPEERSKRKNDIETFLEVQKGKIKHALSSIKNKNKGGVIGG